MSKFKAVSKMVISFKGIEQSQKKTKFDLLKSNLKERKQSISVKPGDLNSKYEQDEQLQQEMQKLYNARYEMDEEELEDCESGLDDLEEDSEEEKSEEIAEDSDDDANQKAAKEAKTKAVDDEESDDERISLDSDIEAILKDRDKSKEADENGEDGESDGSTETETESETDEELDNIIETEGEDYDDADEESAGDWEEDIDYSDLEEEEDSDAFSFTGLSAVTDAESRFSSAQGRKSELNSRLSSRRRRKGRSSKKKSRSSNPTPEIDDTIQQERQHEEVIVEETAPELDEEIIEPDITYSRSVSVIEEYESDVFDNIEDISLDGEDSGEFSETGGSDTQSRFSVPRNPSAPTVPRVDNSACADDQVSKELVAEMSEEIIDGLFQKSDSAGFIEADSSHAEKTGILDDKETDQLQEYEDKGQAKEYHVDGLAVNLANEAEIDEFNTSQDILLNDPTTKTDNKMSGSEEEPCSSSLPESFKYDAANVSRRHSINAPYTLKCSYQSFRQKQKRKYSWTKRTEIYERARDKKYRNKSRSPPRPDSQIPSYKAHLQAERYKIETAELILQDVVKMMDNVIKKREIENEKKRKQDIAFYIVEISLENAVNEIDRREAQRPIYDMANNIIEDMLDMWECKVDTQNMMRDERDLQTLATDIVNASLLVSIRDVMGNQPYFNLPKQPKIKEINKVEDDASKRKGKRLLTKSQRYASRQNMIKARSIIRNNDGDKDLQSNNGNSVMRNNDIKNRQVEKACLGLDEGNKKEQIDNKADIEQKHDEGNQEEKEAEKEPVYFSSEEKKAENEPVYFPSEENEAEKEPVYFPSEENEADEEKKSEENVKTKFNKDSLRHDVENGNKQYESQGLENSDEAYQQTILQGMEQPANDVYLHDSEHRLKSLPKANKKEYCMQWLTKTPSIPSPPRTEKSNERHILAGRLRRFKKHREQDNDRRFSTISDEILCGSNNVCVTNSLLLEKTSRKLSFDSGVSEIAQTGRETSDSFRTLSSLSSHDQRPISSRKESLSKETEDDIRLFYDQIFQTRIEERQRIARCKEKEEPNDEGKENGETGQSDEVAGEKRSSGEVHSDRDSEMKEILANDPKKTQEIQRIEEDRPCKEECEEESIDNKESIAATITLIENKATDLASMDPQREVSENTNEAQDHLLLDAEDTELQYQDDVESQSSQDTIWPTESPAIFSDRPRAETPGTESEPEPEVEPELEPELKEDNQQRELKKKNDRIWAWKTTTGLIRWRNIKPVIKQGATASYYRDINLRIRKTIFDSLSLRKPRSWSDLHKDNRLTMLLRGSKEVQEVHKAHYVSNSPSKKPVRKDASCYSLPPLSLQNSPGRKYKKKGSRKDMEDTARRSLPEIAQNFTNSLRPRAAKNNATGAWY